jgi:AcrR family transcriptional regulator
MREVALGTSALDLGRVLSLCSERALSHLRGGGVAKSGVRRGADRPQQPRRRIVDAAIETLKREGFAGTSARAIASTGGFSQGLVFYHFGTLSELLLAALDETSARRMARYAQALEEVRGPSDLLRIAREIFEQDLDEGHTVVLTEMISAASTLPELGPEVVARIEPWIAFAADAVRRAVGSSPLEAILPDEIAGFALVGLFLGVELLAHLQADRARARALFDAASALVALIDQVPGPGSRGR